MDDSFRPIEIVGIDTPNVGSPRNDGTRGSGLYRVPIKLSEQPPREWADALPKAWDHPPQFTTMHRPGIASISGDVVILDGTTIEEVRDVHAQTLVLIVGKLNLAYEKHEERSRAEANRVADERSAHEANVRDTAKDIKFD